MADLNLLVLCQSELTLNWLPQCFRTMLLVKVGGLRGDR